MNLDGLLAPGLLATAALLLGMLLTLWWMRALRSLRGRRHQRQGGRAERRAERLLTRAGYRILERQPVARWLLWVDEVEVEVHSRADLLVSLRGRRFIAEVKAGEHGAHPTRAQTRRQLLEYAQAFDVDGVVLVDMRHGRLHRVSFGPGRPGTGLR